MYHFIGLGGIGMSALARILLQKGISVQGSDRANSPLLEQLRMEGACVQVGHSKDWIRQGSTVVYSSGIHQDNEELRHAQKLGLPILHRSELLDQLIQGKQALLVTGTHGKTTTSALLASVLYEASLDPAFVVGGILRSFDTNARLGKGPFFVAEADESDGSFLKTCGFGAIVTNLDRDHLNFWGDFEQLSNGFRKFFQQVQNQNHLFWCIDDPNLRALSPPGISYGFSQDASVLIQAFKETERGVAFSLLIQGKLYEKIDLALFGRHQALNGAAVFALALSLQIPEETIRLAFLQFAGTRRRLELKGEVQRIKVFDDYGHHPVEIKATIRALRGAVRERRLVVVFQPHRYSRLKDLFNDFAACFDEADEVILTDIYSAGEAPIEGVTVDCLYHRMKMRCKVRFFPRTLLEREVAKYLNPLDVVLTLGAGDITLSGELILRFLAERMPKIRVALIYGGTSAEHEVSIQSADHIAQGLDPSIYDVKHFGVTKQGIWIDGINRNEVAGRLADPLPSNGCISPMVLEKLLLCDVCLPVFHGPQGEDGMIQGFLDTFQIPYAGCNYRSGAICMHKGWTKRIALSHQIRTAQFFEVHFREYREDSHQVFDEIHKRLQYPVWVKPVHLGSSIGVSCAKDAEEVKASLELAFRYDDTILIEEHVEGRQVEFGVFGNDWIRVGPPCEILSGGAFVDYQAKYGEGAMPYRIPAGITDLQSEVGIQLAKMMYLAAGCKGLARIDFFLDQEGCFWLNEINPFPGCTRTSAFPKIWAKAGMQMKDVCDELVLLALHQSRSLQRTRSA